MQLLPPPILGFLFIGGLIGILLSIFWIWMLIDSILNPALVGLQKLVWVLVVLLSHFIGALLYFFLARSNRTLGPRI